MEREGGYLMASRSSPLITTDHGRHRATQGPTQPQQVQPTAATQQLQPQQRSSPKQQRPLPSAQSWVPGPQPDPPGGVVTPPPPHWSSAFRAPPRAVQGWWLDGGGFSGGSSLHNPQWTTWPRNAAEVPINPPTRIIPTPGIIAPSLAKASIRPRLATLLMWIALSQHRHAPLFPPASPKACPSSGEPSKPIAPAPAAAPVTAWRRVSRSSSPASLSAALQDARRSNQWLIGIAP